MEMQKSTSDDDYYYGHEMGKVVALRSYAQPETVGVLAGENPESAHTTCTWEIAKQHYPNSEIKGYNSFELGIDALKKGIIKSVLVPVAYPMIRQFIMDNAIIAVQTFREYIPSLVHVTKSLGWNDDQTTKLYTHPAPRKIAETLTYEQIEECTSNEQVCIKLLENPDVFAAGVTNIVAAQHFGLHIRKVLITPLMPWILFARVTD
jgi:hypothetical protein